MNERPGTVTAAAVLTVVCGFIMFVGGGCGVHASVSWIAEAKPMENRVPFGVLGIAFCVVFMGQGAVMLRYGPVLFRGRPYRMEWLQHQFGVVIGYSFTGLLGLVCDGLANSDFSLTWWTMIGAFSGMFGLAVTVLALYSTRATQTYLDRAWLPRREL